MKQQELLDVHARAEVWQRRAENFLRERDGLRWPDVTTGYLRTTERWRTVMEATADATRPDGGFH